MKGKLLMGALLASATTLVPISGTGAGLGDWLNVLRGPTAGAKSDSALTEQDMAGGLRAALEAGVQHAVQELGRPGGYLDDAKVRIPLPAQLTTVGNTLRRLGQGRITDQFVASMNQAAERAAPEAAGVFMQAIRQMSVQDARAILQGPQDAATQYFRRRSGPELVSRMLPIVSQATDRVGVTARYKELLDRTGGIGHLLGSNQLNLDQYVTDRAVDGLFVMIAQEEKQIRENPAARTTQLLRKVFGAAR
ncbi:MAG: DUF4197 domain-containing protein [Gammaproteobacteria bacterium]|nr:DUF4197 domain-containing protein [Gammaproteobacteria bacterium]